MSDLNEEQQTIVVREATGLLATGLADELARPLRAVRDLLASVISVLDDHVATAKGPDPLSYEQSKAIRETIATAYLKSTNASRIATDLAAAVAPHGAVENCDLNKLIDDAVSLVEHRFSNNTELFIDHGSIPTVQAVAGDAVLALVRVLLHCADSTRNAGDGAISIRTRVSGNDSRRELRLTISENGGGGDPDSVDKVATLLRRFSESIGGSLDIAATPGTGSTFVLRAPEGGR